MAFAIDAALDAALNYIKTNGTMLHICTSEPANYAGIAAVELAKAAVSLTGPADRSPNGRKVTIPAVVEDTVDTTGTAAYWALSNGTDTLIASGALSASVALTASGVYSTGAVDIGLPDFTV